MPIHLASHSGPESAKIRKYDMRHFFWSFWSGRNLVAWFGIKARHIEETTWSVGPEAKTEFEEVLEFVHADAEANEATKSLGERAAKMLQQLRTTRIYAFLVRALASDDPGLKIRRVALRSLQDAKSWKTGLFPCVLAKANKAITSPGAK